MNGIVQYLLHQSINVSFVILVVYLVRRLLLRKVPKKYSFMLWGVVALRLLFPGVESPVSMFNLLPTDQVEKVVNEPAIKRIPIQETQVEKVSEDTDAAGKQRSTDKVKTVSENKLKNAKNIGTSKEKQGNMTV